MHLGPTDLSELNEDMIFSIPVLTMGRKKKQNSDLCFG